MATLQDLFLDGEFSVAELSACAIDGELWGIDASYVLGDCPDVVAVRARCVCAPVDARCVAASWSAAWIHGAILDAPARHTVALRDGLRLRFSPDQRYDIAQMAFTSSDVMGTLGSYVTTPLRTAVDLARFTRPATGLLPALAHLMATAGATLSDAQRVLDRGRHLPYKVRAFQRLEDALALADAIDIIDSVDATHAVEQTVQVHRVAHFEDKTAQRKSFI